MHRLSSPVITGAIVIAGGSIGFLLIIIALVLLLRISL
jgi:hypothetical protein